MQSHKPSKIFYLINSLHKGGAERQLLTISPELGGTIVLLEDEIHYAPLPNLEILVLSKNRPTGRLAKMMAMLSATTRFIQMVQSENRKSDVVVVSFLERSNLINLISSAFSKHRAILSIRVNLSIGYKKYPLVRWFFKKFYKKAYAITSNSAGVCGQMIECYNVPEKKVFHVPNCYDIQNILKLISTPLDLSELEQLIQTRTYFVCINRLDSQKNIGFQIELIAALKKIHPSVCLIVVGDGPQRNALITKAENTGLSVFSQWARSAGDSMQLADIIFLGHTHNPYRLCSFSKALLLTSDYESLPNVVIEALICKTVVLAADCDFGPREILSSIPNYNDPNRKYGKMDCGILLPLIESNQQSMPMWLEYSGKILLKEIVFKEFEAGSVEKIKGYALPSIINKWESLLT
jgi:glycosyltransferase involved in cell wall biosynthesis